MPTLTPISTTSHAAGRVQPATLGNGSSDRPKPDVVVAFFFGKWLPVTSSIGANGTQIWFFFSLIKNSSRPYDRMTLIKIGGGKLDAFWMRKIYPISLAIHTKQIIYVYT